MAEYPETTAKNIAKQIKLSDRTIEKHIAKLKQMGIIERVGSTKSGYWKIIKQ